jgi:hypothetical protein
MQSGNRKMLDLIPGNTAFQLPIVAMTAGVAVITVGDG